MNKKMVYLKEEIVVMSRNFKALEQINKDALNTNISLVNDLCQSRENEQNLEKFMYQILNCVVNKT